MSAPPPSHVAGAMRSSNRVTRIRAIARRSDEENGWRQRAMGAPNRRWSDRGIPAAGKLVGSGAAARLVLCNSFGGVQDRQFLESVRPPPYNSGRSTVQTRLP